jgi:hypothetical protein
MCDVSEDHIFQQFMVFGDVSTGKSWSGRFTKTRLALLRVVQASLPTATFGGDPIPVSGLGGIKVFASFSGGFRFVMWTWT